MSKPMTSERYAELQSIVLDDSKEAGPHHIHECLCEINRLKEKLDAYDAFWDMQDSCIEAIEDHFDEAAAKRGMGDWRIKKIVESIAEYKKNLSECLIRQNKADEKAGNE